MAMTIDELVSEFASNVAAQTDAIFRGDAKTGNKHQKRYVAAFKKLRLHGDAGLDALRALLTNQRADVQATAAAYLLGYRTDEAKAVLQAIAKGDGLASFEAEQALKRWEDGTWALDIPASHQEK